MSVTIHNLNAGNMTISLTDMCDEGCWDDCCWDDCCWDDCCWDDCCGQGESDAIDAGMAETFVLYYDGSSAVYNIVGVLHGDGCDEQQIDQCTEWIRDIENAERVFVGTAVTEIGSNAFGYCQNLTEVTLPPETTSIGASAFTGCTQLSSLTVADTLTEVGYYAFNGCSNLTQVTILRVNNNVEAVKQMLIEAGISSYAYWNIVDCDDCYICLDAC